MEFAFATCKKDILMIGQIETRLIDLFRTVPNQLMEH
jgi:hypothetical protein